ncbi:hemerythrin domain-containing protein [Micromonospora sp. NBC_01796]|uniref:hemerythrin domain-containing protein n=1 Tax=Micromonospora sp. NBC_01796 TaxID=2975987 RepID=UPI002DDA1D73|nr:hemerythrin domain-containing protein [Micromonospora sp. NBC_01796]WSA86529.1 hemerythrin domain-containing protein [Micromonospora sp. NBC_01796]
MTDAVSLIQSDHRVLEKLLHQLRDPDVDRVAVVDEVAARLTAHRSATEQVYPLLAGAAKPAEAAAGPAPAIPDLGPAQERLDALRSCDPDSERFEEALKEFADAVTHHIQVEETDVLPEFAVDDDPALLERAGATFETERVRELKVYGIDDPTPGQ